MKVRGLVLVTLVFGLFGFASQAQAAPLKYVALGDSYSAASGVLPLDPEAPVQCLRSTLNYPHVLAEQLGAELTDVTCGAAETKDFFEEQYPGVAPQLDSVAEDTELVTMTIGGNDSGVFINAILSCGVLGLASLGQGSPCSDTYGSSFEDTINGTTLPSLVEALSGVHEKAPNARVVILSYPWIMPETGGCFPQMPVAEGDVPYLRSLQRTLNNAVRKAASETDSIFVNLNGPSNGHDACQAAGTRWVEPVIAGSNPVIVHPNALGESKMAEETFKALSKVDPPVETAPRTRIKRVAVNSVKRRVRFWLGSSVAGSTFRCRLDKKPMRNCKSPKVFRNLKPGRHVIRAVAISPSGKQDRTPAVRSFRIIG